SLRLLDRAACRRSKILHVTQPIPWYIAGPLIGLVVPALLVAGNKPFGISSNLRHLCAAVAPCGIEFFSYDWKRLGGWNLAFLAGIAAGAAIAWRVAPCRDALAPHARGAPSTGAP